MSYYDYLSYENRLFDAKLKHSKSSRAGDRNPALANLGSVVGVSAPSSGVLDSIESGFSKYFMNPLVAVPESIFQTATMSPQQIADRYGPPAVSDSRGPQMSGGSTTVVVTPTPKPNGLPKRPPRDNSNDRSRKNNRTFRPGGAQGRTYNGTAGLGRQYVAGSHGRTWSGPRSFNQGQKNRGSFGLVSGRGSTINYRNNQGRNQKVYTAYNAMSTMPRGAQFSFGNGRKPGSLRLKTKVNLGQLTIKATSGLTSWIPSPTVNLDISGMWYCVINNYNFLGDGITARLAQYFDKYYVNNISLEYNAAIGSSSNYGIAWCFCDSPDHWDRLGYASNVAHPTKSDILMMSNSRIFPAWTPSEFISCSSSRKEMYTSSPLTPTQIWANTVNVGDFRQCVPFTAGICVNGVPPASDTYLGDIFLHLDVELVDMTGLLVLSPSLSLGVPSSRFRTDEKKKKSSSVKSDGPVISLALRKPSGSVAAPRLRRPVVSVGSGPEPTHLIVESDSPVRIDSLADLE